MQHVTMTRLKFLLFALAALGLWGYHLTVVGPAMSNGAVEAASDSLKAAPAQVALALEAQRSKVQAAMMAVAGSPAALNAGPKGKEEPPTAERFNMVRAAAASALPEADRAALVVLVVNEGGALVAQGAAEPGPTPEGMEPDAMALAGFAGTARRAYDAPHVFYATPMLVSDRGEVKQSGSVVLGLPLLPNATALAEKLAKDFELAGVQLAIEGKPVAEAGPDHPSAAAALKLGPGTVAPLAEGPAKSVGPLALPLMVPRQVLSVGLHQPLDGSPVEIAVSASTRPAMEALASYQVFALGGLGGLLFLSIVVLVLLGGPEEHHGPAMVVPAPMPAPSSVSEMPAVPASSASSPALPFADQVPDHPPAPEASPDDFDFPSSPSTLSNQPSPGPTGLSGVFMSTPSMPDTTAPAEEDPFAMMGPPPAARPPPPQRAAPPPPPQDMTGGYAATQQSPAYKPPAPSLMDDDDVGERTTAYPANFMNPGVAKPAGGPVVDPFAMAGGNLSPEEQHQGEGDYNPDATRVAAVPQELIKQARSAGGATAERPALRVTGALPSVQSVAPVAPAGNEEERHFQQVFRDFVATREKCGEGADGLTYDKFRAKLVKNKDQLTAKYNCRTVRFQVYVKDGKAALKATPVKD